MTNQREIIAQVRRMAERPDLYVSTLDVGALLALLKAQQAVVDAATKLAKHLEFTYGPISPSVSPTKVLVCELNAALEKVKP